MPHGCPAASPDCGRERLNITIAPLTDEPWHLRVPLPVSERGTSAQEWALNVTSNGPIHTQLADSDWGPVLEVRASGHLAVQLWSQQVRPGHEAFMTARWTTQVTDDVNSTSVFVEGAIRRIDVLFEARSERCARADHLVVENPREGWVRLPRAPGDGGLRSGPCE